MAILDRFRNQEKGLDKVNVKKFIETFAKTMKQVKKASVTETIVPDQMFRSNWTLQDWYDAVDTAEDYRNSDKYDLMEIFNDAVDDYAVYSAMQQRTTKVINSKIMFLNPDGKENEEMKTLFVNPDGTQKQWFRKWLKIAQDVKYYGFEVAELGAIYKDPYLERKFLKDVMKIPEKNLIPMYRVIKKYAEVGSSKDNLIAIDRGIFSKWLIPMGSETDLGLINKVIPYVIYKDIFANWKQHSQIFGQPFREGRTDIFDNDRVLQMQKMFEEMTGSSYGIFHPDDEINFIETQKTDAFNIYDRLIGRCDHAITKIFLSQTGTSDEESYVGSAESHERVMKDLVMSDRLDISEYFTGILIPKLKFLGIIPPGVDISLTWIVEEHLSLKDWADIIQKLSMAYTIPAEEITKRFDMEVEEKEIEPPPPAFGEVPGKKDAKKLEDIMAKTQQYYQGLWNNEK